jgi:hypothetical protein
MQVYHLTQALREQKCPQKTIDAKRGKGKKSLVGSNSFQEKCLLGKRSIVGISFVVKK